MRVWRSKRSKSSRFVTEEDRQYLFTEDWRSVLHSPIFSVIHQREVKEKENRAGANGEFSERMSHVASTSFINCSGASKYDEKVFSIFLSTTRGKSISTL